MKRKQTALNAGNNQQMIVCAFSYTETCSFRGSQTRTYERFHTLMHTLLFPFWRAFFCAVKAGGILVPDPVTEHCGQRYDCNRYAHILIQARMHANSDLETSHACVSYMFMMMKSVLLLWTPSLNDHSKLKGQCTDVESGCNTSVGPNLSSHSLS